MTSYKIALGILIALTGAGCSQQPRFISSPNEQITVDFFVEHEKPGYRVMNNDAVVLESSSLGLFFDGIDLSKNVELVATSPIAKYSDQYEMLHGKQSSIQYSANQQTFSLQHESGTAFDIQFNVSNDGIGFRYIIDESSDRIHTIEQEFTSFNLPENSRAWMQHMANAKTGFARTNPSYEEYYHVDIEAGTPAPDTAGWIFPALFKTGENWILLSETGLDGSYPGTKLHQYAEEGNYTIAFPQYGEQFPGKALDPQSTLPWTSPWRILVIGDLETITESTLVTDLADPATFDETSWIKPGRAAWSWAKLKDASVNYDTQKEFIDYAANMGWEYVLVDVNWNHTIGYKGIGELANYADSKDVGLILWYNSSGDWNDTEYSPKSALLTHEDRAEEFSRIQKMGIKGVKVDFFAGDGQSMIQYYLDIFEDAADHQLLVNTHGTTLPRGWHRTWPNLMTMESVKGFEFITFEQQNADQEAVHSTILPFTRNVFSPMDFTPMSPTPIPNIDRKSTPAFQIAQPVIFTSGIQHYAETAEGMKQVPDFAQDLIQQIPVDWDETQFVDGYPGKYVVIARRHGEQWFVAGLNGENEIKNVSLDLSFIPETSAGIMITDGEGDEMFSQTEVSPSEDVSITPQPTGGFVMLFEANH